MNQLSLMAAQRLLHLNSVYRIWLFQLYTMKYCMDTPNDTKPYQCKNFNFPSVCRLLIILNNLHTSLWSINFYAFLMFYLLFNVILWNYFTSCHLWLICNSFASFVSSFFIECRFITVFTLAEHWRPQKLKGFSVIINIKEGLLF